MVTWERLFESHASLKRYIPTLEDEELTPSLLASMTPTALSDALAELKFEPSDAARMVDALAANDAPPENANRAKTLSRAHASSQRPEVPAQGAVAEPPPAAVATEPAPPAPAPTATTTASELFSPPRDWPASASKAARYVKTLRGTRVRLVGSLNAEQAAPLAGLRFKAGDARGNAMRVRDRTGWAVLGGFALYERADGGAGAADGGAYVGLP